MNELTIDELRQQLHDRIQILKREQELGEQRLQSAERESLNLQQTMLRISGAIQVLNEILHTSQPPHQEHHHHQPPEPSEAIPAGS
jgi:hypothetical protein